MTYKIVIPSYNRVSQLQARTLNLLFRHNIPQSRIYIFVHPDSNEEIVVKDGRYGPYVSDGKINASLNNSFEPDTITLEQATELINEKRAKGPTKRKRKKKKK